MLKELSPINMPTYNRCKFAKQALTIRVRFEVFHGGNFKNCILKIDYGKRHSYGWYLSIKLHSIVSEKTYSSIFDSILRGGMVYAHYVT
jgi:hypothetical protein